MNSKVEFNQWSGRLYKIFFILSIACELNQTISFPLIVYKVATDGDLVDSENSWHHIYEITTQGAVLVRPDGHVAWRSITMPDNPKYELEEYLKTIVN